MYLYILGSLLVVFCGVQYGIISKLETIQGEINSLHVKNAKDADAEMVSRTEEKFKRKRTDIAFTAYLSTPATKLRNHQVIPFDKVLLNEGQGFNEVTHIFTCPVSGTYNFQTSLICVAGSLVLTEIVKEGITLVQVHSEPPNKHAFSQGFNSVFTKCGKGEHVWVRLDRHGHSVYSERYSTFSGFLLWEDK